MKKITRNLLLILIMLIPVFFLSGCENVDWDLLEIFVQAWAEEEGLYKDGKYSPYPMAQKVAEDTIGDITNKKPFIELDGLDVIRDIEKADQLADEAMLDLDTAKMSSAVSLRPHDWILQEKDAAVWLAHGNAAAAQTAFAQSDDLFLESLTNGEDCVRLREQQLKKRRDTLFDVSGTCQKDPNCTDSEFTDLWTEYTNTSRMLSEIFISKKSDFCPDT
ncbi:MAG: hypothetical protein MUO54_09380 [Anaerolineales bacterium]|nr:hypothetical protein [Anaerolineales bacterium]